MNPPKVKSLLLSGGYIDVTSSEDVGWVIACGHFGKYSLLRRSVRAPSTGETMLCLLPPLKCNPNTALGHNTGALQFSKVLALP